MSGNSRRLVLFDIDGTLLSAGRASREALVAALEAVCPGGYCLDGYEFSGKTDPQIVKELLAESMEEARIDGLLARTLDLYLENLERRVTPEAVVVKRGVTELLRHVSEDPEMTLGLLTGNHERGARIKLGPPGFNSYFPFGAFGSDHADRYQLPRIAVDRARGATGRQFRGKEIVVIGDSIHDVACGRSLGVKSVAVATGLTRPEALAREKPDFLFEDLADLAKVSAAIAA
jgi:phosphoglycolate phosphatase